MNSRVAAVAASALLAVTGAGCGDDKEGPGEDVGKEVDKIGREGGQELKEAGKKADRELNDGKGE